MSAQHRGVIALPGATPSVRELLVLRPGVHSARDAANRTWLISGEQSEPLGPLTAAERAALQRLASEPQAVESFDHARSLVRRLRHRGWLGIAVWYGGRELYRLLPHRRPPSPYPGRPAGGQVELSSFAVLRREAAALQLESFLAWCSVVIRESQLLPALTPQLGARTGAELPAAVFRRLRRDLQWAGLLVPAGQEEDEFRLRQWRPHELWFHWQSRAGGRPGPGGSGGTEWARGRFPPLPAVRPPFPGPTVDLATPDLAATSKSDPSLTDALEQRRTTRRHNTRALLRAEQLGEFLYRCCRNRGYGTGGGGVQLLSRPYPSGGSLYELEVYPAVTNVHGVAPGLYHYEPDRHRLAHVCAPGRRFDELVQTSMVSAALSAQPQVVLVIAARFGRVMWKYEAMSYALILRHVGVLYQTMYLVATAMGLAACALGGGRAEAFAAATDLDPLLEGSVGEFLLGSPALDDPERRQR